MSQLMNPEDFRAALEAAIRGNSANKAPFSVAWASGKLTRAHLARWAENHYHYVGPFADYLGYIYARFPDTYTDAKDFMLTNMYEEEIGGDRHTDLLIRFAEILRHHRRTGEESRQHVSNDARPAELVLHGGDARGPDRRGGRPCRRP